MKTQGEKTVTEFISGLNPLLALFLIAALGYLLGGIKIKGIELGTAGVLLVALVFGHFGCEMPTLIRDFGLALFVTSVGFIAGPKFFRNFKQNAKNYIFLGFIIILSGALVCAACIFISGARPELMVGLMTGALTSTPGLGAAQGAAGEFASLAAIGYAIAYPFGVVGVVLFVQIVPKLLKVDMQKEVAAFEAAGGVEVKRYKGCLLYTSANPRMLRASNPARPRARALRPRGRRAPRPRTAWRRAARRRARAPSPARVRAPRGFFPRAKARFPKTGRAFRPFPARARVRQTAARPTGARA